MIKNILNMLSISEFYAESEAIDIAKGINQLPKTIKQGVQQVKRKQAWKKRR
jgi:hypothetical protein